MKNMVTSQPTARSALHETILIGNRILKELGFDI